MLSDLKVSFPKFLYWVGRQYSILISTRDLLPFFTMPDSPYVRMTYNVYFTSFLLVHWLKCLVTGASSGIGKTTCEILTGYGATVIGSGRNQANLEELKAQGSIADFVVADITQDGECKRLVTKAVELLDGSLTTVVIAHGGLRGGAVGDAATTTLENYHWNMKLNTQAPFEIIEHAVPHLKKISSSSIVTVSSVNGKQSFASCASYCMSKAAVDQLTRCASIDLAKFGIRVNNVNPGVIKTNLHKVRRFLMKSIESSTVQMFVS
jgi:NAD(P)-dependent dehydrogenase (short-subunit alcohol dehydrogenase family)